MVNARESDGMPMKGTMATFETLPELVRGLVEWLVRAHGGDGTSFSLTLHDTNHGQAVQVEWSEQLWAWLWVETIPVRFACGWPGRPGGSKDLAYPRTCRQLERHVRGER